MGQPVVQLDVRNAALSAREAQANLESARAQKQLAEEECKRTKTLLDKGAITRSEYNRQATQCTSTLQQVSAAQARADMDRQVGQRRPGARSVRRPGHREVGLAG